MVRTRPSACSLLVEVEGCRVDECGTGVAVWCRGDDEPARRVDADPVVPCPHEAGSCPGTRVRVLRCAVPHPRIHGMSISGQINDENKTSVLLEGNEVSHVRNLGVLVCRPDQPHTANVMLRDNTLVDTGEQRVLTFPGLRACVEERACCTRNVTGKRFELQAFFRCHQCKLVESNNLGVCASCAHTCHAGHEGLYLYGVLGAYCDCPELKDSKCSTFIKDPLYKEDKPDDDY